jgi:hypothetical protein
MNPPGLVTLCHVSYCYGNGVEKMGERVVLESLFVEFRPVADAEAVHDAGMHEVK